MDVSASRDQLVWVTRTVAINPAHILEVFHGHGGQVEVHLPGRVRQLTEDDLTAAGRALLLPPGIGEEPDARVGVGAKHTSYAPSSLGAPARA